LCINGYDCKEYLSASFQPENTGWRKSNHSFQKKIIAMSSVKHRDVSEKTSRCRYQTIGKTLLYHWEDFFVPFRRRKKSIMMSSGKHYSVLEKAL
jgi:hypothetical protein